jgi:lipopolysaccharide biosynthesis glycosyltransferase
MLHSVLAHNAERGVEIHFMHGPDVSRRSEEQLTEMVEREGGRISFLRIPDERVEGLPTKGFTRKATWYRIFLPELRPDVDRVLYLDADLIALEPLDELWETDMGDSYVAAVTNVFEHHYAHRPAELGLAGPHVYFNAGVLLMNLDLMRRDDCSQRLLDYGVAHARELLWRDQDTLNVVLGHRRLELRPRWNCMNAVLWFPWAREVFGEEAVEEALRAPAIRHFEGPRQCKPWHYLCERPSREMYMRHRRETPWPRMRVTGVTPRNVLTRWRGGWSPSAAA